VLVVNVQAPERLAVAFAIALLAEAPGLDRGAALAVRAGMAWRARRPLPLAALRAPALRLPGWRPAAA
jgi:hypothetical protein